MATTERKHVVVVDERLSKGLVREETRALKQTLRDHGHDIFVAYIEGVRPRFSRDSRLTPDEMKSLAGTLHETAERAYRSVSSDLVLTPPTRGRPNAGSYDMQHYWVRPIAVAGDPFHQMRLAVFTANGDRKNVEMSAHDTPVSFNEHAAHRLLQRRASRDAAVRAIAQRLAQTIILPALALNDPQASLVGTSMHIPFEDGLLLGTFIARKQQTIPGGYFRIRNRRVREGSVSFGTEAEFVVKTFIGCDMMSDRQRQVAAEINTWLAQHHQEAVTVQRHLFHPGISISGSPYLSRSAYDALTSAFRSLREAVFGPI